MTNDIYSFINDKYADFEFKVGEYITLSYDWELTGTPSSNTTYPTMIRAELNDTPYRYGTVVNSIGTNSPTTHVKTITANEKSGHIRTVFKIDSDSSVSNAKKARFRIDNLLSNYYVTITNLKLEKGNKPTNWSPAVEDVDNQISDTASVADQAAQNAGTAISKVNSLERQIQNIVVDDNKLVSVTQDGNGIKIDMTAATNEINQLLKDIDKKATGQNLEDLKKELEKQISALSGRTAYINASTDSQGRPVITLGATDSPFKVQITNEAINFIQNGQIIAYANGQKFYNLRTVVQQDVQIGNGPGFIWRTRDSGNMGLTWVSG